MANMQRGGPVWGLTVFGLFVWFVAAGGLMEHGGWEGPTGAGLFGLWVCVIAWFAERRRRRAK